MAGPEFIRDDVAWIWFGAPKAVRVQVNTGADYTFIGLSRNTGIWVARLDNLTHDWTQFQLRSTASPDDHDIASIGIRKDGRLLVAYSEHNDSSMRVRISTNPFDVSAWETEITAVTSGNFSYPNLVYLTSESRWYMFLRETPEHYYITSDNDGQTWSALNPLIAPTGERPYVHVASNSVDRVDFLVTTGHPAEVDNSIFHFKYVAGVWQNSAGVDLGPEPIAHASMTKIHDGPPAGDNSWNWDIAIGADGNPVVLYDTFPDQSDHRYWYARWDGTEWIRYEVAAGGRNIASSGSEPFYSAGMALDHSDPNVMYLALPAGTEIWNIEQWATSDGGTTWNRQTIIANGTKNMRPVTVRNGSPDIIWFQGTYNDYIDFDTDLYWASVKPIFPGAVGSPAPVAVPAITSQVRWYGCKLSNGQIIAELPDLVGEFSRVIGRYTSSNVTLPIPLSGSTQLALTEQATEPCETMLVAVVNDVPTWAGIVMSRDGGTGAEWSLGLASVEAYLEHRVVRDHLWVQQDEASIIAAGLLGDAGPITGVGGGINLTIDSPATGKLRDRVYKLTERKSVYQALGELMDVIDGPEWTIDLDWQNTAHTGIALIARVRSRIGTASATPPVFETLGEGEARYRLLEEFSGEAYANYVVAYSSGEGDSQPASLPQLDTDNLATGAPIWEQHYQPSTSITDVTTLNDHAAGQLARVKRGALRWELEARWDAYPRYGIDWRIGDDLAWVVRGHRHPEGITASGRAVGMSLDTSAGVIRPILDEEQT